MWNILEHPPQPFGECTICKRHTCGEYEEDGVTKQKWIHTPLEMDKGGNLVIGYQCIQSMSEDAGISKKVVERVVTAQPTAEQIAEYVQNAVMNATPPITVTPIESMSRDELKAWLKQRDIEFTPQWGEDKLRELAIQHV